MIFNGGSLLDALRNAGGGSQSAAPAATTKQTTQDQGASPWQWLIQRASDTAAQSQQVAMQQLDWARRAYENDRTVLDRIVNANLDRQAINDRNAAADRQRYERTFQPLENQLIQDARSYNSAARQEQEAGRASADVAQNFELARENATRNLESFGVDPSSTRFAALDLGTRVQQAAAQAGAANMARERTADIGRGLRGQAIDIGRALPGQVAGTYATSLQSGNSGANTQLAGTASGGSTMGTGAQWSGLNTQNLNLANNAVTANMAQRVAEQNADTASREQRQGESSGIGGLIGAGFGMFGLSEGGKVPEMASPTRGRAIDDVPALLNANEFVVPEDVVSWKGEEFFQKLIDGSRKAREGAPAKPSVREAPQMPPTFSSSGPGALPVG